MSRRLVAVAIRYPRAVLAAALLGVALSLLLAAIHLEFNTSRLDLISAGDHYKQLEEAYGKEFEALPDKMIVAIRGENPVRAEAFATALARRWQTDPDIDKVLYRIDLDSLKSKALLYLSPDDLVSLRQKLEEHPDLLRDLAADPSLENVLGLINRHTTTALVGHLFTGFLEEDEPEKKPLDLDFPLTLLRSMNQWLDGPRVYRSPWDALFTKDAEGAPRDGFLWSDDGQLLFVLANPKMGVEDVSGFTRTLQRMRRDVSEIHQGYPELEVGITGAAILDFDEMAAAQRDTTIASVIAALGVLLLYFALFRGVVRPVLALVTLLIGLGWSLGFTTLAIGHLNIFTVVFMPMLLGLGIDYGSYFIARYEDDKRAGGQGVREALLQTCGATCPGIAAVALTTALTFGTLLATGFKGVAELGLIGGSGILLILVATYTVLPALLVLQERRRPVKAPGQEGLYAEGRRGYLDPLYRYPWATLGASGLLVGLSLLALGRVGSDFNLLHLQAEGTESVIWEQRIFESTKHSPLFAEVTAGSMEEARRKAAALKALPSVAKVDSLASLIPDDQAPKLQLIKGLRPLLADIPLRPAPPKPVDLDALRSTLARLKFKMGEGDEAATDPAGRRSREERLELRRLIDRFVATTGRMARADLLEALSAFQTELGRDLEEKLAILKGNLRAEPITIEDLPPELRERYVGRSGQFRLFVFPAEDVWEFPPLARFVEDLRSVEPDALGSPIINFEFIRGIKEAYERAGLYALLGIALLVLITFRAVGPALLALIPLAVGSLWTLGLMGFFQVKFNVANLIVIPLIIAPAVESGIMIVRRYREGRGSRTSSPLPKSTGQAVAFSTLSTIVGFGSLMISRHWGIFSIGLLLALGVGAVLLASVAVLPSLLALLSWRRGELAQAPESSPGPSRIPHPATGIVPHREWPARLDARHQEAVSAGAAAGPDRGGRLRRGPGLLDRSSPVKRGGAAQLSR